MTNEELKQALITGAPVICETPGEAPLEYARVRGILYRRRSDMRGRGGCRSEVMPGIVVCAELLDKGGNSVTVADAADVRFAKQEATS